MISRVPTVEQLVEAAICDADSLEIDQPPSEKIAFTKVGEDGPGLFEETAKELDSWAEQAEELEQVEQSREEVEKELEIHDTIFKLAMASTVLHTLRELEEHGQLGRLVEKNAYSDKLTGRERVLQLLGQ